MEILNAILTVIGVALTIMAIVAVVKDKNHACLFLLGGAVLVFLPTLFLPRTPPVPENTSAAEVKWTKKPVVWQRVIARGLLGPAINMSNKAILLVGSDRWCIPNKQYIDESVTRGGHNPETVFLRYETDPIIEAALGEGCPVVYLTMGKEGHGLDVHPFCSTADECRQKLQVMVASHAPPFD